MDLKIRGQAFDPSAFQTANGIVPFLLIHSVRWGALASSSVDRPTLASTEE